MILEVNNNDSLYVENTRFYHGVHTDNDDLQVNMEMTSDRCPYTVVADIEKKKHSEVPHSNVFSKKRYHSGHNRLGAHNVDFSSSIGMGFYFPDTFHMFGLPERKF